MNLLCIFGFHHPVYACGETVAVTACTRCGVEVDARVRLFRPERDRAARAEQDAFWAEAERRRARRHLRMVSR